MNNSFTVDAAGRPTDQVGYMGHPITVETPSPPALPKAAPPAAGAKKKRTYRYPEWRRKRARS